MSGPHGASEFVKKAVALRYEHGVDEAPTVLAAGQGYLADRLLEVAREAGVPIESNPDLADALSHVSIGTVIPEDLYPVVAELLVFVNRLNQRRGEASGGIL